MENFVAVIDYGLGNLRSVSKALELVGAEVRVTNRPQDIVDARSIVLPGVGAFKRAMDNLSGLHLINPITQAIQQGKPFLGICLGLQVLFTESEEYGTCQGLGLIRGRVRRFKEDLKIPHMGWNSIQLSALGSELSVFKDIPDQSYFYFVHSYFVEPENDIVSVATTEYGREFTSVVNQGNLWGIQFHPEKSSDLGLKLLKNFVELNKPLEN
ncbi:imidazole glycerol phosphate synthase subunit HisH [Candidatus Omnitrophota bacterium]